MMEQLPSLKHEATMTGYFSKFTKAVRVTTGPTGFKAWLARIGIGSRITFKHIHAGRRKVPAANFKSALDLSFVEAQDFDRLTAQATASGETTANGLAAASAHDAPAFFVVEDGFFKTPLNTIVLNLCGVKERMDRLRIHEILGAGFGTESIDNSIAGLLALQLIERTPEGHLNRIFEGSLKTLPGAKSENAREYFKTVNDLASRAWSIPLERRELQAFNIRIDQRDVPRLKDLVRNFRVDCANLSAPEACDSVYQCSVAAFPIYIGDTSGAIGG